MKRVLGIKRELLALLGPRALSEIDPTLRHFYSFGLSIFVPSVVLWCFSELSLKPICRLDSHLVSIYSVGFLLTSLMNSDFNINWSNNRLLMHYSSNAAEVNGLYYITLHNIYIRSLRVMEDLVTCTFLRSHSIFLKFKSESVCVVCRDVVGFVVM